MLPIHAVLDSLKAALDGGNTAVLAAPPGAGKSPSARSRSHRAASAASSSAVSGGWEPAPACAGVREMTEPRPPTTRPLSRTRELTVPRASTMSNGLTSRETWASASAAPQRSERP